MALLLQIRGRGGRGGVGGRGELTLGMKSRARVVVTVLWVWKKKRRSVQSGCREGTSTNLRVDGREILTVGGVASSPPHSPLPQLQPDLHGAVGG